jgi:uncharacterized iron-regulated membrane protein
MKLNPPAETTPPTAGALYRAAWRWHFYAGIVAAPLAIFLAITGALYLWTPQYEEATYRGMLNVPVGTTTVSAESQMAAAQAAFPKGRVLTFEPAFTPGRASETRMRLPDDDRAYVLVDPYTGKVTGSYLASQRAKSILHDLHGSFMAGKFGGYIVELGASWMFVLLLTGFYLWWPRPKFSVWGFLLPRLRAKGRVFWRDIHAVPAVWFSFAMLFLLATGIPWSGTGGKWVRSISSAMGEGSPDNRNPSTHHSEVFGWSPPLKRGLADLVNGAASQPGAGAAAKTETPARISIDQAIAIANERKLEAPFAITMPVGKTGVISAMSSGDQIYARAHLHLDQYTGKVIADVRYKDYGFFGKFFLWGIIAHEGHLFGLANQILGTIACFGVILISASGLVLWWKRKPEGKLGAPVSQASLPKPMLIGTLLTATLLPLLAASLVLLFLVDLLITRRIPWLQSKSA